jgi:outer membrane receptor protein involved in Fe transport
MHPISAGTRARRYARWRGAFAMTALASLIASAYAQEAPAAPEPEKKAEPEPEKKAEAAPEKKEETEAEKKEREAKEAKPKAEPAPAQKLETVTITGFRSSLAKSAQDKREGIGLSETIFAEDMGKFPDANIADALARIPGVTVTRGAIDGEGLNVSIRGMGAAFTRTLLKARPWPRPLRAVGAAISVPIAKSISISCLPSCSARSRSTKASRPAC